MFGFFREWKICFFFNENEFELGIPSKYGYVKKLKTRIA